MKCYIQIKIGYYGGSQFFLEIKVIEHTVGIFFPVAGAKVTSLLSLVLPVRSLCAGHAVSFKAPVDDAFFSLLT